MPQDSSAAIAPLSTSASPSSNESTSFLQSCAPVIEELSRAVTCPICLELMSDARQLKCGHLFCSSCLVRMLGMEKVRCAICKEKTSKRMVRDAPLPFDRIVAELKVLEECIDQENIHKQNVASGVVVKDGFESLSAAALARVQNAAMQTRSGAESNSGGGVVGWGKRCSLCPKGVDAVSFGNKVNFGPMSQAEVVKKQKELFVHEQCALFSPEVYELNGVFRNVGKAIGKCKKIVCGRDACGRSRANVACDAPGCRVRFHYPCAVVENAVLVEDGFKMFCEKHKGLAPEIDENDFTKNLANATDTANLEHDDCCYLCNRGGRLLMCDTCSRVTHPVCSGLKGIPLGDWSCGVCTGDAIDVEHVEEDGTGRRKGGKKSSGKRPRDLVDSDDDSGIEKVNLNDGIAASADLPSAARKVRKALGSGNRISIAHTGLKDSQKRDLSIIAKGKKAMMRANVDRRVTHLVISVYNKSTMPVRTMKLCRAVAAQIPILCWEWVNVSNTTGPWAPFGPYIHPLTWPKDANPVFNRMRFYFGPLNGPKGKKEDLSNLVVLGGGSLVTREPSADMVVGHDKLMYVRDEDTKDGTANRRELLTRYEPPALATIIPSSWILDQCTKNRNF